MFHQGLKAGPESSVETGRVDFQMLVARAGKLYTLPDICLRLRELTADSSSSAAEIARLIATDPALTARLLRLANSALYGFRARISTVTQAVTLIGIDELNNLALATAAAGMFSGIGGELVDMRRFWKQSAYAAIAARQLGRVGPRGMGELLFVAGLLSNIGKLVLLEQLPGMVEVNSSHNGFEYLPGDESALLGFTYADLGAALMQSWSLPEILSDCVACQHDPQQSRVDELAATRVYVAVRIADALSSPEQEEGANRLALIDAHALDSCALDREHLDLLCSEVLEQAPDVIRIFSD